MKRRAFLLTAAVSSVQATTMLGCGGSSEGDSAPAPALPPVWDLSQLFFVAGSDSLMDLSQTLPAGVVRGGTFGVSPGGSALPPNLVLAPNGILRATTPPISATYNIIFTYTEPA